MDVNVKLNLCEIPVLSVKRHQIHIQRNVHFKTRPSVFVLMWLALVKEKVCICGIHDHLDAFPQLTVNNSSITIHSILYSG